MTPNESALRSASTAGEFADRRAFPTPGQILRDHLAIETPVETIDAFVEKDARERLY